MDIPGNDNQSQTYWNWCLCQELVPSVLLSGWNGAIATIMQEKKKYTHSSLGEIFSQKNHFILSSWSSCSKKVYKTSSWNCAREQKIRTLQHAKRRGLKICCYNFLLSLNSSSLWAVNYPFFVFLSFL